MSRDENAQKLQWMTKQKAYAWAKFYETTRDRLTDDHANYHRLNTMDSRSNCHIPEHIKTELKEMAKAIRKKWECPVCLDMIDPAPGAGEHPGTDKTLEITNCGHYYCLQCLKNIKRQPEPKCAVCRRKISAIGGP